MRWVVDFVTGIDNWSLSLAKQWPQSAEGHWIRRTLQPGFTTRMRWKAVNGEPCRSCMDTQQANVECRFKALERCQIPRIDQCRGHSMEGSCLDVELLPTKRKFGRNKNSWIKGNFYIRDEEDSHYVSVSNWQFCVLFSNVVVCTYCICLYRYS